MNPSRSHCFMHVWVVFVRILSTRKIKQKQTDPPHFNINKRKWRITRRRPSTNSKIVLETHPLFYWDQRQMKIGESFNTFVRSPFTSHSLPDLLFCVLELVRCFSWKAWDGMSDDCALVISLRIWWSETNGCRTLTLGQLAFFLSIWQSFELDETCCLLAHKALVRSIRVSITICVRDSALKWTPRDLS